MTYVNLENTVQSQRYKLMENHATYDLRKMPSTSKSTEIHNRSAAAGRLRRVREK